jgi:hypothetical protein
MVFIGLIMASGQGLSVIEIRLDEYGIIKNITSLITNIILYGDRL